MRRLKTPTVPKQEDLVLSRSSIGFRLEYAVAHRSLGYNEANSA